MDKNSIIGLVLMGVVLIAFGIWSSPDKEEMEAMKRRQDSIAALEKKVMTDTLQGIQNLSASPSPEPSAIDSSQEAGVSDSLRKFQAFGMFAAASEGQEQLLTLENEFLEVTLTNRGGKVKSVHLKQYKRYDGSPLVLFEGDSNVFGLNFFSQNRTIATNNLFFKPVPVASGAKNSIRLRLEASSGSYLDYVYSLEPNSYLLQFDLQAIGMQQIVASNSNYLELEWKQSLPTQEKDIPNQRSGSALYYKYIDDDVEELSATADDQKSIKTKVKWVAFKQQFFTSVALADNSFDKPTDISCKTNTASETEVKQMAALFSIPFEHKAAENFSMQFYYGPNHYQTLKKIGFDLEKQIPLGWGIFGWVNKYLVIPIFNFLNSFNLNFGLIILILTIVIKLILTPFTYKSYLSTAKMKVLKPEVDEIQAKRGDDPMKTQQELMALYRKAGVNPLGGCIPMLFQMPILIAMFRFFPSSIELRQESFLWAEDLSTYDSILDLSFSIPFYGNHVSLFTLLMTLSTLLYTYVNNQMAVGTNPQMKWMMYLMPIAFLGFLNNYSAGLSYYYFLANMISFGQQYLFRALVDEKAIHARIQENKKKPQTAKKSGFQQRLEQMARERGYKK